MTGGLPEKIRIYTELTKRGIQELESIIERLSLIPELKQTTPLNKSENTTSNNKNVFIVHGHDDGAKQTVARFIEKLGLNPIILHEQANQGQTIIEKFEAHSNVGFAIILLTPDDTGGEANKDKNKPRARQNVILELGYFIGSLGRKKVCALYTKGVELPSDLSGILYVSFEENDTWKFQLAKEIKASGIDIDLNLSI
jgi:predicted nucleotide-binding protein